MWGAGKSSDYLLGKHFKMETDHKPLVPLLGNKNLDNLPPRILCFRVRLSRFMYTVEHAPGKSPYTTDTLSRNLGLHHNSIIMSDCKVSSRDADCFVNGVIASLPAFLEQLQVYKSAQAKDNNICQQISTYCKEGWLDQPVCSKLVHPYWDARHKFTLVDGLLMYGLFIVVSSSLQEETLNKIHTGHLGVQKCLLRAKTSVWWPGMTSQSVEEEYTRV